VLFVGYALFYFVRKNLGMAISSTVCLLTASSVVAGVMFGAMAETGGWNSVFPVAIAFGIAGAVAIGLMWNAPADGYEKLNRVIREALWALLAG
jgi:sugar phosphate permease